MSDVRADMRMALLFVIGLAAGLWTVAAPWVIPYPTASGGWTSSTWAAVWVGAVVAAASALGLVVALALAARDGLRSQPSGAISPDGR